MSHEWYDKKESEKNSHTHSLFVVITGTPQSLFEIQRELFTNAGFSELEIKKFEIKPIQNS